MKVMDKLRLKAGETPYWLRRMGAAFLTVASCFGVAGCDSAPVPEPTTITASQDPTPDATPLSHEQVREKLRELFVTTHNRMVESLDAIRGAQGNAALEQRAWDKSGYSSIGTTDGTSDVSFSLVTGYQQQGEYESTAAPESYGWTITYVDQLSGDFMQYLSPIGGDNINNIPDMSWDSLMKLVASEDMSMGTLIVQMSHNDDWVQYQLTMNGDEVEVTRMSARGNEAMAKLTAIDVNAISKAIVKASCAADDDLVCV